MLDFFKNIFQSSNQRRIREYQAIVKKINDKESAFTDLSAEEFKTFRFDGDPDDSKLIDVFAAVREASNRTIGLRHFDCQLIGGLVLNGGNIAEMKTGEGKTLVATLPAVLNALSGKKVFVVTVNDYLAERDANWMRPIYEYFGLSVNSLTSTQSFEDKKNTYDSDIIYCTSSELGFDYLRDNMVLFKNQKAQKNLNFAIVDEVDSILIDEARTPLIISGATDDDASAYPIFLKILPLLKRQLREGTEEEPLQASERGDFLIDEKIRSVDLTEDGFEKIEKFLTDRNMINPDESLYTTNNLKFLKYIQATLKANLLFEKNVHYVVEAGKVVLIDDNTGRKLPGRRISEGVHQALECKEKVQIQQETQTLASTTYQNFFRLFDTISGMTGTADTEAAEFKQIYNMDVVVIPTNQPMIRDDVNDIVYVNEEDKYQALISEIKEINAKKAPILVGTASIESSEKLSKILKKEGVRHQVLNAKYHEKEANIIAEAGRPGAITIATNTSASKTYTINGGDGADILSISADSADLNNGTAFTMSNIETISMTAAVDTGITVGAALLSGKGIIIDHAQAADTFDITVEMGTATTTDLSTLTINTTRITTADEIVISNGAATAALTLTGADGIMIHSKDKDTKELESFCNSYNLSSIFSRLSFISSTSSCVSIIV